MKKIILKSVIFLTILLLILIILSKIVEPKNNTKKAGITKGRMRQTAILAEPENTIDVIFAGDSEAYTSYIPLEAWNQYGFTSYVCGSPGQKLPSVMMILYEALQKQQPKIVMLETNTIYKRAPLTTPLTQIAAKLLPVFQYHNRWKTLNEDDFFGEVKYTKKLRDKGFYMSNVIKSGKNKQYMTNSTKKAKVPKSNKLYVQAIKKYCDSKGIELILYSSPSVVNWNKPRHNGIEQLARELDVEYIDMNMYQDEIKINWKKDSRDEGDHLNYTGSLKASKFLADYLNKKNLPDHRNDITYKSWKKSYSKYIKEVNKNETK